MASASKVPVWWIVVLAAAVVLPRLPLIPAAFDYDDPGLVQHVSSGVDLGSILFETSPIGFYRPIVVLYFNFCELLFGDWAPGYHLVSIALHGIVVWLVFLLCAKVGYSGWPAMGAALGFALLPSHNEAIAWAASAGDLLAALFTVAAVLCALAASDSRPGAESWRWVASLAFMVVGFAAKETAIASGLLVPVAAWLFGRCRPAWGWTLCYPAVTLAYLSWLLTRFPSDGILAAVLRGDFWQFLVWTGRNIVMMVVPFERNLIGTRLLPGLATTRLVAVVVVVFLVVLLAQVLRSGNRVTAYGWFWSVAAFLPVCWLGWAERYAYLPSVGLALVAAAALGWVQGRRTVSLNVVLTAVLVVFAAGSVLSALQWTQRVGRYAPKPQNRSSAAAQWKPAPKAARSTRSPALIRPC